MTQPEPAQQLAEEYPEDLSADLLYGELVCKVKAMRFATLADFIIA